MKLTEPRVQYAVAVLTDLFPGATVGPTTGHGGPGERSFALAPSARRPRLLVPTSPRGAAAAALRAYGGRLTRTAQVSYAAAARALAVTGPTPLRNRLAVSSQDGSRVAGIDDHLSEALGRPVAVGFHLTPARANRKPIVQLLAAGEPHPVGFAKVGVNDLTSRLVRREADALSVLAARDPGRMVVPAVSHHGRYAGFDVLALAPLPTWQPGQVPSLAAAASAAAEIAELTPVARQPLAGSDYWRGIRDQVRLFSDQPRGRRLAECIDQVEAALGDTSVTFTASHGDFSPWNMWLTADDRLLVWDWERFESQTPAGLDLLHFWLNEQFVRGGRTIAGLGDRLIGSASAILAGSAGEDLAQLTAVLYLVHLGVRYEVDRQADAGAELGRTENWLLPALSSWLADPPQTKRT